MKSWKVKVRCQIKFWIYRIKSKRWNQNNYLDDGYYGLKCTGSIENKQGPLYLVKKLFRNRYDWFK